MNTFSRLDVGRRLAQIRGQASHEAFAARLGVHKNTYGGYERGQNEIGAEALSRLASEGWNVHWLVTGEGPERLDQLARGVGDPRAGYGSQSVKLDREILARAGRILELALEIASFEVGPTLRAQLLGDVYEHLLERGSQGDELLEVTQVLRDKLREIRDARTGFEVGPAPGKDSAGKRPGEG